MEKFSFILTFLLTLVINANAQLKLDIVDEKGYAIPFANATYRGHHVSAASDIEGRLEIMRREGWTLTISSVGFKEQTVKVNKNTPSAMRIVLREDSKTLNEVVVIDQKGKYSRKNNPAVELMKRVIAAKKKTDLSNKSFYQYNKYQKISLALNDINPLHLTTSAKSASTQLPYSNSSS